MEIQFKEKLFKVLSRNDTGETNSHQSGISIPKKVATSDIFPRLGIETLNPRAEVVFFDENNIAWKFQYIYYNDIYHGKPRHQGHDEFRLTCVKDYIREYSIKSGDQIWFGVDIRGVLRIGYVKAETKNIEFDGVVVIKLSNKWKTIKY